MTDTILLRYGRMAARTFFFCSYYCIFMDFETPAKVVIIGETDKYKPAK